MSTTTHIFITGATGYIGDAVLERVLLRHPVKVGLLRSMGVKTVVGALDDGVLLERQASESDAVFACANADHVGACEAILRGLHPRSYLRNGRLDGQRQGDVCVRYHLGRRASRAARDAPRYPTSSPRRSPRARRRQARYVRTHIVLPSTVYGFPSGPLVELGIQNPRSIQIPRLVNASLSRSRAGMVGSGLLNRWPNVHIDDGASVLASKCVGSIVHPPCREGGEHALRIVSEKMGEVFVELGGSQHARRTFPDVV